MDSQGPSAYLAYMRPCNRSISQQYSLSLNHNDVRAFGQHARRVQRVDQASDRKVCRSLC